LAKSRNQIIETQKVQNYPTFYLVFYFNLAKGGASAPPWLRPCLKHKF